MTNRQIQICPACNRATEIVFIHGHGQCSFCKTNIDPCCSGETAEHENKEEAKKNWCTTRMFLIPPIVLKCTSFFPPWIKGGGSSLKGKISHYEPPTRWKGDTFNELPRKYCKTLIIYQISQNKSIYSGAWFFDPLHIDFRSLWR